MQDGTTTTDNTAWGSTVIGTNAIGDGYWDTLYITNLSRPVARVAFQTLTASETSTVFWGSCRPGEPQCPAVDEVAAFKDYIRRNLEYRRGVWRPERRGYIVVSLWSVVSGSVNHITTSRKRLIVVLAPGTSATLPRTIMGQATTALTPDALKAALNK